MSKDQLDVLVSFRLTVEEDIILHEATTKSNMNRSEYLRALISVAPVLKIEYKIEGEK